MTRKYDTTAAEILLNATVVGLSAYAGVRQATREANMEAELEARMGRFAALRIDHHARRSDLQFLGSEFGILLDACRRSFDSSAKSLIRDVIVRKDRGITCNQLRQLLDVMSFDSSREELCRMVANRITNPGKIGMVSGCFSSSYSYERALRALLG